MANSPARYFRILKEYGITENLHTVYVLLQYNINLEIMKNPENELEKDDINNPEQFQVGRAPQEEKEEHTNANDLIEREDDAGYSKEDNQFADGEGTLLNEEIDTNADELDDDSTPDDENRQN